LNQQTPEEMEIARRRKLADALGSMAMQRSPSGQMVGRVFVGTHPLEHIAKALQAYGSYKMNQNADTDAKALGEKQNAALIEGLRGFQQKMTGTPEKVAPYQAPSFDDADAATMQGNQTVTPAVPADPRAAYAGLIGSQVPMLQQMGVQGMGQLPQIEAQKADRADARAFQSAEAEKNRLARVDQLNMQHQLRMDQLAAQNASREEMMRAQQQHQLALKSLVSAVGKNASQPYFQPVQTAQGVMAFNARTGKIEPVALPGGAPVIGAAADPALQGSIAGAKAGAQVESKAKATAKVEAPQVISQGEEAIKLVDELLKAPGFKQAVGGSRVFQIQKIPGTDAKDFDIRLDQLKGKQFLLAFETLKGGGHITEIEGKKATDAIARMDAAGSEPEFVKAAKDFQDVIRVGVERAKKAQGGTPEAAGGFKILGVK